MTARNCELLWGLGFDKTYHFNMHNFVLTVVEPNYVVTPVLYLSIFEVKY